MKEKLVNFARRTTLRQLRALGAVTSHRSIAAAAQSLSVTPPAVTQQLQLLEDTLGGVPLFERTPDGARPTEAGGEVLRALGRIEAALGDCATAIEALRSMDGGPGFGRRHQHGQILRPVRPRRLPARQPEGRDAGLGRQP